jgi:hypothetical protein
VAASREACEDRGRLWGHRHLEDIRIALLAVGTDITNRTVCPRASARAHSGAFGAS